MMSWPVVSVIASALQGFWPLVDRILEEEFDISREHCGVCRFLVRRRSRENLPGFSHHWLSKELVTSINPRREK